MKTKTYKSPPALATRLEEIHAERMELQHQVDALKAEEDHLLTQARDLLRTKQLPNITLASGFSVRRVTVPVASIKDWPGLVSEVSSRAFEAADHKTRDQILSVIHKRVSPTQLEALSRENIHFANVTLQLQEQAKLYVPKAKGEKEVD